MARPTRGRFAAILIAATVAAALSAGIANLLTSAQTSAAKAYRAYWRKLPGTDGDDTLDHSAITFLMARSGQCAGFIACAQPHDEVVRRRGGFMATGTS